ncbi:Eotaxin [Dissostichus eleginoides]|uniref:Eotaxin n=1 Tax=Dissostichus eleginoides TaxID=100907 RepID=A0AAD9B9F4_DISEL|nr:Eotaxin [Dissostichus eleginoides]
MTFSLMLAALLCCTTWMSTVHATIGPESSCCSQWSLTRIKAEKIQDYTIQSEGSCPITAIVFHTKSEKRICSDPNNNWAKSTMKKVDKKKEEQALQLRRQKEEGSTSSITPAVSATTKEAPPQRRRKNGKKCQGKKTRRGRKGQRNVREE